MSRRVVVMKLPVTSCPRLQASSHPKLHAESDADLLLCSSGTWGVMGTLHRLTDLCLPPPDESTVRSSLLTRPHPRPDNGRSPGPTDQAIGPAGGRVTGPCRALAPPPCDCSFLGRTRFHAVACACVRAARKEWTRVTEEACPRSRSATGWPCAGRARSPGGWEERSLSAPRSVDGAAGAAVKWGVTWRTHRTVPELDRARVTGTSQHSCKVSIPHTACLTAAR